MGVLLTTGVMLAQLRPDRGEASNGESVTTGILATLGIALSSGFAAVYTEKVIKRVGTTQQTATAPPVSGLAYTQIQLAMTSLVIEGAGPSRRTAPRFGKEACGTVSTTRR